MTTTEILNEIQTLPLPEQCALAGVLQRTLPVNDLTVLADDELERREDEFERHSLAQGLNAHIPSRLDYADEDDDELEQREIEFEREMLAQGLFCRIPDRTMTDEEFFEDFELLEIEGEPLSEQIIRERR